MTNEVIAKIRYSVQRHMFKLILSLLIIGFISAAILAYTILPTITTFIEGPFSVSNVIMLFVAIFLLSSFQFVLLYGFFVLIFLFYDDQYAVLAHLFSGFKDFKRAFILGMIFTAFFMGLSAIISVVLSLLIRFEVIVVTELSSNIIMVSLQAVLPIIFAALFIKLGFTWFFFYENISLTVKDAIKKSRDVTKGCVRKFLQLAFKSAGSFFVLLIITYVLKTIVLFVPIDKVSENNLAIVYSVLNFISTICLLVTVLRFSFSLVAMYKIYNDSPLMVEEIDNRINNLHLLVESECNSENNREL